MTSHTRMTQRTHFAAGDDKVGLAAQTLDRPVGIIAALHDELHELLVATHNKRRPCIGNREFWSGDPVLLRRIRAQGNFIEYVPIGLILLARTELRGAPQILILATAGPMVIGRIAHAI